MADGFLTTHVLDTASGRPAAGLRITLESADGSVLAEALTDDDGRIGDLAADLAAEDHVLRFDTGAWFAAQGVAAFYPEVVVTFAVAIVAVSSTISGSVNSASNATRSSASTRASAMSASARRIASFHRAGRSVSA